MTIKPGTSDAQPPKDDKRHPQDDVEFWLPDHVGASDGRRSGDYYFVPGQVLISERDYRDPTIRRILDGYGLRPFKGPRGKGGDAPPEELMPSPRIPGLVMLTMALESDSRFLIPDVVDDIRRAVPTRPAPQVAPNHVFFGATHAMWGPATVARPAPKGFTKLGGKGIGLGVSIVVVDTGSVDHPLLPGFNAAEFDVPDEDGDTRLDYEAGHGAFIYGVIRRYAPAATVEHKRVMTSNGRVSDISLAARLLECSRYDVVNLSLGGYTHDNRGAFALPIVLEWLRHRNPNQAVVAAAGNDHTDRPFYPAASKWVIGVAACDENDDCAYFSNFGWWVDARARGDFVSTFYNLPEPGQPNALHTPRTTPAGPADFDGWAAWEGTSFAAPVVSAAIAAQVRGTGVLNAREAALQLLTAAAGTAKPNLGVRIAPTDFSS